MNEQPAPDDSSVRADILLRRASPRAFDRVNGAVKTSAFLLRPTRSERELSFYAGWLVSTPEDLLEGAPGRGWGVVAISVESLINLGFSVRTSPNILESVLGPAHVSVVPPAYDEDGQIPNEIRAEMSAQATWVIEPNASFR